jgi:signal transduction histidine kinase
VLTPAVLALAGLAALLALLLALTWRRVVLLQRAGEGQARLQKALKNAAREWLLTFDAVESPLLVVDVEGRIKRLNRAASRLADKDYREVLGFKVDEMGSGEPWRSAGVLVEVVAESREPHGCSADDPATGRTWDLAATLSGGPAPDDDRIVLVARDITGIVELQRSLRRSELMSALGSLVAGVAHEVRNPLFAVSAVVDAFENRFGGREEYRRYLEVLKQQVGRLNELMRELLDYGKPPTLRLASEALPPLLAEAIENCSSLAVREEVEVATAIASDLPPVTLDRGRMLQVLQNLLENAIQHTPRGRSVRVEACLDGEGPERWAVCRVVDSGPGFREEDLGHIFEPFFSRRRGGTGLGLSIVQRIVEQHGGRIAASNLPRAGAVMEVKLPVASPAAAPLAALEAEPVSADLG